ncbi:alpha/beta hydrolase [Streptomyces sp. M19]
MRSRPPTGPGLPPALCVHGLGGSSLNWSALMERLADRLDVEALDLPGFGDSPPPDDGDYSITGQARTVIRYLDTSGRGPVHLIGNSMGGAITTRVAAVRPDLVRTLTLVSPALPELRPQRTAVPTALIAVPGLTRLFTRLTRDWTPEQRTAGARALLRRPVAGDRGGFRPGGRGVRAAARAAVLLGRADALHARHRRLVHPGRPALAVAPGRAGPGADAAGLRDARPAGGVPDGAQGERRVPGLPAAVPGGRRTRGDDGVPEAVARGIRELLDQADGREHRDSRADRGHASGDTVAGAARTALASGADGSGAARG